MSLFVLLYNRNVLDKFILNDFFEKLNYKRFN